MTARRIILTVGCWLMTTMVVVGQQTRIRTKNFTTRDGMASNVVNCGLQDRQGYIWFGTNHGLTRFDGHRFVNFYVDNEGERQIEGITHIVEDTVKKVLLMSGKDYRLLCFDLGRMRFMSAEGMKFPQDADEERDEQEHLAHAQALGADVGNRTNRRHGLHYARLDDGREIFATLDNGFFIYESVGSHLRHYRSTDENPVIESDYFNGIMKDRSGGVWLLTTFAGVYRLELSEEALRTHTMTTNVRSLAQLDSVHLAVGDMEGHVYCYDPDTRQSTILFDRGIRAYAVNKDSKGRLWIGTRGDGVWIVEELKNLRVKKVENLPARQVYDIKFSSNGTVWIATLDGGLIEGYELPDGSYFFLQHFKEEKIHEIGFDLRNRLWMATENGLLMYSVPQGDIRSERGVKDEEFTDTLFNKGKVVCVFPAPDGTVWAGSNGYGLLKIENETLSFIRADDGLVNNCVESVTCDHEGNVIVGTDQGVSIVNSSDGSVRNLYSSKGLRANTYNENAILYTTDRRIFLGSLTGLVELRTTNVTSSTTLLNGRLAAPCITGIEVNNEPRYYEQYSEIRLPHDENSLCFHFSSFAYTDLSSIIYSYRLEKLRVGELGSGMGIDRDWRTISEQSLSAKENRALYTNLTPGHYRFHVRCRLAGTPWSEETICDITIAQPWYWTWWARLFYLLIIVLFIWYEWHQYQQRLSLQRQLDQRLTALYAVEAQQEHAIKEDSASGDVMTEKNEPEENKSKETAQQKAANQRNRDFLDRLDHLILQNLLQTDLDVNFIAQEMCVSYSTLHRRIKSLTGITANEYVRKHRLTKAMQLLRDGHNASEVAMQCGFNSPSYFTRCFKAEYGILPSEV